MAKVKVPLSKIVLFKSKTLSDGTHPIMLRITYQGRRKYYSLHMYSMPSKWNKDFGRYNRNKEANSKLDRFDTKAEDVLKEIERTQKEFSFERFEDFYFKSSKPISVFRFWQDVIEGLKEERRFGTSSSYNDALKAFKAYRKNRDLVFIDINYILLDEYRKHLSVKYSINTTGIYLRSFRAIYNRAVKSKIINKENYPFENLAIKKEETQKRALHKTDIGKIAKMDLAHGSRVWHSRNFFIFGYLCQGINFADLADLKWNENINLDRLCYRRKKTGKLFTIKIQGKIEEILIHYRNEYKNQDGFIFPIMNDGLSEATKRHRLKSHMKKVNKDLKHICKELEIPHSEQISFYWSRHSYATSLKRSGVLTSQISEALGHSSEKVTQVYLDSFENDVIDKANENLL